MTEQTWLLRPLLLPLKPWPDKLESPFSEALHSR